MEQKTAQEQQREESRKILAAKEQELAKIAHRQQELTEHPLLYSEKEAALISSASATGLGGTTVKSAAELEQERLQKEQNMQKLKEVEQQQEDFGEKK